MGKRKREHKKLERMNLVGDRWNVDPVTSVHT